jgi:hypothetical protein
MVLVYSFVPPQASCHLSQRIATLRSGWITVILFRDSTTVCLCLSNSRHISNRAVVLIPFLIESPTVSISVGKKVEQRSKWYLNNLQTEIRLKHLLTEW